MARLLPAVARLQRGARSRESVVRRRGGTARQSTFVGCGGHHSLAALFVPASITIIAAWDVRGRTSVALRRDYAPLLICVLFSAAGAFLLLALASLLARPLENATLVQLV